MNIDRMNELFDCEDGKLIRKTEVTYNARAGMIAGTTDKDSGYVVVSVDGKKTYVHRIVWALAHGAEPDGFIDHIDGSRANNRIENLRCCSNSINMQNVKGARRDSKTGVLGVSLCKLTGKYVARIRKPGGAYLSLGRHVSIEQASAAYLTAKRELHAGCTI